MDALVELKAEVAVLLYILSTVISKEGHISSKCSKYQGFLQTVCFASCNVSIPASDSGNVGQLN